MSWFKKTNTFIPNVVPGGLCQGLRGLVLLYMYDVYILPAHLLIVPYFVFETDAGNFKDSVLFHSLVHPSGTISLSLCQLLRLSVFKPQLKTHIFSLSPNASNSFQPVSSNCVCAYICVCVRA